MRLWNLWLFHSYPNMTLHILLVENKFLIKIYPMLNESGWGDCCPLHNNYNLSWSRTHYYLRRKKHCASALECSVGDTARATCHFLSRLFLSICGGLSAGAGDIKMSRTERILALMELSVCASFIISCSVAFHCGFTYFCHVIIIPGNCDTHFRLVRFAENLGTGLF